jgi:hypothetical protein
MSIKEKMIREKKNELIVICAIVGFCLFGNICNYFKDKQISNRMQFTCAQIKEFTNNRTGMHLSYSFTYRGIDYKRSANAAKLFEYGIDKYRDKHFIVVFDSTNIGNNSNIILFKEHLLDYNLSIENWNNCVDSSFRVQE